MSFSLEASDIIERIIDLRLNLDTLVIDSNSNNQNLIPEYAKNLLSAYQDLSQYYPDDCKLFIQEHPKYAPLSVLVKDKQEGYYHIINSVSDNVDETVTSIIKEIQGQKMFGWLKKNNTQLLSNISLSESDKHVYIHMSQFNLPKVKQEEIGDCIALAFTGKLSEHAEEFNNPHISLSSKETLLKELMVNNRKYINWDFKTLSIIDKTDEYSSKYSIYKPRGIAAGRMIDSTYVDDEYLYSVICTNNTDTSTQGAQAFELYKTLESSYERDDLTIDGKKLKPSVIIFNNAFFCTEDYENTTHITGRSTEKEGYHHNNIRFKFDSLFDEKDRLTKSELDKINGLTVLSLIGNELSWPRFPHTFDICDLIYCNPITSGSDTLWLYSKFEQLKIHKNPERTRRMYNFLLDYSNEIMELINKAKPNDESPIPILADIKSSLERLITGITTNFTTYNLDRDLNSEEADKLSKLTDSIRTFNDNHPNQKINLNLISSLQPATFYLNGEETSRTTNKKFEKFKAMQEQEKIDSSKIIEDIESATKYTDAEYLLKNDKNCFVKFNFLTQSVYGFDNSAQFLLSVYLTHVLSNVEKAENNSCDYFKIPKSLDPNYGYYYNFIHENSQYRKKFKEKIQELMETNEDYALAISEADDLIVHFFKTFHTKEGRLQIIQNGGLVKTVNDLYENINSKISEFSTIYKREKFESFQVDSKFSNIAQQNLGVYWNNAISSAIHYQNFDQAVGIIHEYLNRIEKQMDNNQKVSGKSFEGIPNKIITVKDNCYEDEIVLEAVKNLITRFNNLGDRFNDINLKNSKNSSYKPKHYKMF